MESITWNIHTYMHIYTYLYVYVCMYYIHTHIHAFWNVYGSRQTDRHDRSKASDIWRMCTKMNGMLKLGLVLLDVLYFCDLEGAL
jgi:hypothetical protein